MSPAATVTVPATTANIGPGFDCLGAALSLYNRFQFTALDGAAGTLTIQVTGDEADRVATDSRNLAYQAFSYLYQQLGQPVPAVAITIDLAVPLARGLGSSSTAIVGGLVGANQLAGAPLDQSALTRLAIAMEGHPDNVVPALTGGCQLAVAPESVASEPLTPEQESWVLCPIAWHRDLVPVVAIPDFELSTAAARQVLPQRYSRADAIFNTTHLGLLLRGLETGRGDWLRVALGDRIHQPYRQTLIPGYEVVAAAATAAGAYGLVISGAGPTLLALAPRATSEAVRQAMADSWAQQGQHVRTHRLSLDIAGVRIT